MDAHKLEVVGLGELRTSTDASAILMCIGLGSCIGVCLYDARLRIAGLAHVVLPTAKGSVVPDAQAAKYADTGVPRLVQEMSALGARRSGLIAKICGGASMITAPGFKNLFNTGEANAVAVQHALEQLGIKVVAKDVGGHHGRTIKLSVATGVVLVVSAGKNLLEL